MRGSAGKMAVLPRGATGFAMYTLFMFAAILAMLSAEIEIRPGGKGALAALGLLAAWRYSWGLLHLARSVIYRSIVFPKLRAQAEAREEELMPSRTYFLITSFRIAPETTVKVFSAAIDEAIECATEAVIVASLVELGDELLAKELFRLKNPPDRVRLLIVRIHGTGKRDGLAAGFRAISRDLPPVDAVVSVVDGDSILERNLMRKCAPFFKLIPGLGALTTDEICAVEGTAIMREWHDLRFAQRQIYMSSIALSGKVLTLTGRMSMFRADIVTDPDFIAKVQGDHIEHWRLGRLKFLTGDDKSSWFWVLSHYYDMLYVPDARVMTIEHPPSDNFFRASTQLMFRWFGNMLRTNGRALELPPEKVGMFTWWCILDQRLTIWTSLTGPVFAVMMALQYSLAFIPLYILWVGFTRWVMALVLLAARPALSWRYPFLIYYNQIWGACIKTYAFFRLDRQSWTRQKTRLDRGLTEAQERWTAGASTLMHGTAMLFFISVIGMLTGFFPMPDELFFEWSGH